MKVIDFEKSAANDSDNNEDITVVEENDESLNTEEFQFTCPECKNVQKINMKGMIFKSIEFFCRNCGKKYKAKNNGFRK